MASPWDFLNPFEYSHYASSISSKELREEEGIPDLEDDVIEVAKESHEHNSVASSSSSISEELQTTALLPVDDDGRKSSEDLHQANLPVDKGVIVEEVRKQEEPDILHRKLVPVSRAYSEAAQNVKQLFDRVSDSYDEISKMLEVGKCPFHRKKYEGAYDLFMYLSLIAFYFLSAAALLLCVLDYGKD